MKLDLVKHGAVIASCHEGVDFFEHGQVHLDLGFSKLLLGQVAHEFLHVPVLLLLHLGLLQHYILKLLQLTHFVLNHLLELDDVAEFILRPNEIGFVQ